MDECIGVILQMGKLLDMDDLLQETQKTLETNMKGGG